MTRPNFLILAGLALVGLAVWELYRALTTGSIKLKGGALITRTQSPQIFWFNVAFYAAVACGGGALALWGASQTHV